METHIWGLTTANESAVVTTGEIPPGTWPPLAPGARTTPSLSREWSDFWPPARPPDHSIPAADQPTLTDLNQPMGLCYPFGYETKISSRYICCCDTIGRLRVGNTNPDCRTDCSRCPNSGTTPAAARRTSVGFSTGQTDHRCWWRKGRAIILRANRNYRPGSAVQRRGSH